MPVTPDLAETVKNALQVAAQVLRQPRAPQGTTLMIDVLRSTPGAPQLGAQPYFNRWLETPHVGNLRIVAGDGQVAAPSQVVAVPLRVRVTDRRDVAVQGVLVRFDASRGGGRVTGRFQRTDVDGYASLGSWELGAPGSNALSAVAGTRSVDFNATAAAEMRIHRGAGQSAAVGANVGERPAVLVIDTAGNPVQGITVTFTVTLGGGNVAGAADRVTNAAGIATSGDWALGAIGPNELTARAGSLQQVFQATGT